ncbi:hypothetical protein [Alkalimarinus coralli]|uniref:hypothetical protein n=1 Tax=Alkalimarinus coralli TaxID=2935863 RepID=UPI00202B82A9|nr:hypothetical protein [Alkalimarinus coralli]
MKSQDILILLKLVSLQKQTRREVKKGQQGANWIEESKEYFPPDWQGWEDDLHEAQQELDGIPQFEERYSLRGLQSLTGISKTEISASLKRSIAVGMAMHDRKTGYPKANTKALLEFAVHGLKYVFPVKPAEIVRGIPTSFAAPVMEGKLMTAGEMICVWPDARGNSKGQAVKPLYKSVPKAVKLDPDLYELLALVDAIRLGNSREAKLAEQLLADKLKI